MTDIKEITLWKTQFWKNTSANGGSQAASFKALFNNADMVPIKSWTKKDGQLWGISTPDNLLKLCEKNKGIYEMLHKYPQKVYFDIDKTVPVEGLDDPLYLAKCKRIIEDIFPDGDAAVSGSKTSEKESYHIILNNYVMNSEADKTHLKMIIKHIHSNIDNSFDISVYGKARAMKCFNQGKHTDERIQLIIENDNHKKHLITCFFNPFVKPLPVISEEVHETILIEKSKSTFDIGTLPKMNLSVPEGIEYRELEANDILKLLPLNENDFDFEYIHLVARFCFYNKVSFDQYLSWLKNKHPNLIKNEKGLKMWDALHKFPEVSIDRMKKLLCFFYKHLKKDLSYRDFADTFNIPADKIVPIETIDQTCFKGAEKYSLFNVGMGGGKTAQTIDYLAGQQSFCWIAPNKALGSNTLLRLEEKGIEVTHYETVTTKDKKLGKLAECNKLICCLNSIHYLNDSTFRIIVIDEIETVIDRFLGDFIGKNSPDPAKLKATVWNKLIQLLCSADKVILLDAFITTKTINLINEIEGLNSLKIYSRIYEPTTRTVNYLPNFEMALAEVITKIRNGNKIYIFYPYKNDNNRYKGMENICNLIRSETGKKGIAYNADTDDTVKAQLKNVNCSWKDLDFIVINNIVTCGVNYENLDFDYKYLFIAPHNTPRDIIQVSYRARYLSTGIINICYMGSMNSTNTWLNDCKVMKCKIYNSLYSSMLVEKKAPIKRAFQLFCVKAHYKQKTDIKVINEAVKQEITDLLEKQNFGYNFKSIPTVDFSEVEFIQQQCFAQEATMLEKLALQKYYFINSFVDGSMDCEDEHGNNIMEMAWNEQYLFFFEQLKYVLLNENCVFNKIMKLNKLETIFPSDIKKTKLNKEIIDQIFTEFSFKFIDKTSSAFKIIKEIYNVYFGKALIKTLISPDKHATYFLADEQIVYSFFYFAKANLILDKTLNLTFNNCQADLLDDCIEI